MCCRSRDRNPRALLTLDAMAYGKYQEHLPEVVAKEQQSSIRNPPRLSNTMAPANDGSLENIEDMPPSYESVIEPTRPRPSPSSNNSAQILRPEASSSDNAACSRFDRHIMLVHHHDTKESRKQQKHDQKAMRKADKRNAKDARKADKAVRKIEKWTARAVERGYTLQ